MSIDLLGFAEEMISCGGRREMMPRLKSRNCTGTRRVRPPLVENWTLIHWLVVVPTELHECNCILTLDVYLWATLVTLWHILMLSNRPYRFSETWRAQREQSFQVSSIIHVEIRRSFLFALSSHAVRPTIGKMIIVCEDSPWFFSLLLPWERKTLREILSARRTLISSQYDYSAWQKLIGSLLSPSVNHFSLLSISLAFYHGNQRSKSIRCDLALLLCMSGSSLPKNRSST